MSKREYKWLGVYRAVSVFMLVSMTLTVVEARRAAAEDQKAGLKAVVHSFDELPIAGKRPSLVFSGRLLVFMFT